MNITTEEYKTDVINSTKVNENFQKKFLDALPQLNNEARKIVDLLSRNNSIDEFILLFAEKIYKIIKEQRFYRSSEKDTQSYSFLKKIISGLIFEELLPLEIRTHSELGSDFIKNINSELSTEILDIWNNPKKYKLFRESDNLSKPDLALLSIKENNEGEIEITIEGAGEAKLGLLNSRSLKQLRKETGFLRTLRYILIKINEQDPDELDRLNLKNLAKAIRSGKKITISDNFKTVLFVPNDRNVIIGRKGKLNDYSLDSLINFRDLSKNQVQEIKDILTDNNFSVIKSSFKISSVQELTDKICYSIFGEDQNNDQEDEDYD